jgi:hypothetical protein
MSGRDICLDFTTDSRDDSHRQEMMWEKREENLLLAWSSDCKKRSNKHEMKGNQNKMKYGMFGVPSILIPILIGSLAQVIACHSLEYSLGIASSGLFSAINMFFNFGKKAQTHYEYSNKFFELANEIQSELAKPRRHRIACDVYLEQIKLKYQSLCSESPNL